MLPRWIKTISLERALVIALPLMVLLTACGHDQVIEIDHRFSMNVVRVPAWFPAKDAILTAAEQEVIQNYGAPDFFQFCWRDDCSPVTSSDFSGKQDKVPEMLVQTKRNWIFNRRGKVIEFLENGGYQESPIETKLALVCKYGDPGMKDPPRRDGSGRMIESWKWMEHGYGVELVDGEVANEFWFASTGQGTDIGK